LLPIKQASNSMLVIILADIFNTIQEDFRNGTKCSACRRRHLSSAPGYPAAAAATTRGERVGSGEGERRRKPGEPDTNETA
ncbi:MAG: hypothetical protein PHY05_00490, partial [Methanothrix sp.]|nr:hypothetical protein [Methanothrix sp.]